MADHSPKLSLAEQQEIQDDNDLRVQFLQAKHSGRKPNRQQIAGAKRAEKREEKLLREEYYRSVPKGHYAEMSGRQIKVINDQARTYGLPLLGRHVDLYDVLAAFHDFLARNARKLAAVDFDDPDFIGGNSPALNRQRLALLKIKTKREEHSHERDLGEWIPRGDVREGLNVFANIMRSAGETLQREIGVNARDILDEHLADAIRAFGERFGSGSDDGNSNQT